DEKETDIERTTTDKDIGTSAIRELKATKV
ncbi:hypothetical protein CMV_026209, partial [Castanea mollissima]